MVKLTQEMQDSIVTDILKEVHEEIELLMEGISSIDLVNARILLQLYTEMLKGNFEISGGIYKTEERLKSSLRDYFNWNSPDTEYFTLTPEWVPYEIAFHTYPSRFMFCGDYGDENVLVIISVKNKKGGM